MPAAAALGDNDPAMTPCRCKTIRTRYVSLLHITTTHSTAEQRIGEERSAGGLTRIHHNNITSQDHTHLVKS